MMVVLVNEKLNLMPAQFVEKSIIYQLLVNVTMVKMVCLKTHVFLDTIVHLHKAVIIARATAQ